MLNFTFPFLFLQLSSLWVTLIPVSGCLSLNFRSAFPTLAGLAHQWVASVQFSRSFVSDSSQPHGLQHTRFPCPSPAPGACSNSCPSSGWCHPTISSSAMPVSSRLQSFPASWSFPMMGPWTECIRHWAPASPLKGHHLLTSLFPLMASTTVTKQDAMGPCGRDVPVSSPCLLSVENF